jgi:hypothetical protein
MQFIVILWIEMSLGPAINLSMPCRGATYSRFQGGLLTGWAACSHLLPPWTPTPYAYAFDTFRLIVGFAGLTRGPRLAYFKA